jgi:hypothetical protein
MRWSRSTARRSSAPYRRRRLRLPPALHETLALREGMLRAEAESATAAC